MSKPSESIWTIRQLSLKDSHVVPGLTHRMYLTRENKAPYTTDTETNGGKFRVFGTGKAERQFLFTPDFASIIHKVLWDNRIGKNEDSCLLNICDEREYKIYEVVESISNHLSFPKKNIYYDTSYSDGCMKKPFPMLVSDIFIQIIPLFNWTMD